MFTLALLFTAVNTNAASWHVRHVPTGSTFATFDHSAGGVYENIVGGFGGAEYISLPPSSSLVDDSHLAAAAVANPLYEHLEISFAQALTDLTPSTAVTFVAQAWDGNWCSQDGLCIFGTPEDYQAVNIDVVPVPATAFLFLTALGGLAISRRRTSKSTSS